MITRDPYEGHKPAQIEASKVSEMNKEETRLVAHAFDRLGAGIIDLFVVLLPVVLLLVSPLKREMTLSLILDEQIRFSTSLFLMAMITWSVVGLYQCVFYYWFHATPGKMFFHLKLIDVEGEAELTPAQLLARYFFWTFSVVLHIPLFFILIDKKGRAPHDRIAGTQVVPTDPQLSRPLMPLERQVAKGALMSILFFVGFITISSVSRMANYLLQEERQYAGLEEKGVLCRELGEKLAHSSSGMTRLEAAMLIFSMEGISKNCLGMEAEFALQHGQQTDLAYLAKSFSLSEFEQVSDLYLDRVCRENPQSQACQFTQSLDHIDFEGSQVALEMPAYVRVWRLRQAASVENFRMAAALMKSLDELDLTANFLVPHKVKDQVYQGKMGQAEISYDLTKTVLSRSDAANLGAWVCWHHAPESCANTQPKSCMDVSGMVHRSTDRLSLLSSLAALRAEQCFGKALPKSRFHPDILRLSELRQNKEGLVKVALDPLQAVNTRLEAMAQVLRMSDVPPAGFQQVWGMLTESVYWAKVGETLLDAHFQSQDWESTVRIYQRLQDYRELSSERKDQVLWSAIQQGDQRLIDKLAPKPAASIRRPASVTREWRSRLETWKAGR
ncbi:MAG: hypothetical protein CL675_09720 [Bdellovibrionaceae bacterium]|nr:hypothetical protein [Pseudobdellovibrionaceae bacterium]